MAKISVVIPCYNAQDYIVRCLKALEQQSFKDFDVFCVNDCSSDNTEEVIRNYLKASNLDIHYLKNEVNSGPAYSRNNAIAQSTAEYICFCDSDDWYDEDYLECMVSEAKINDADIVFCDYRMVWDSGKCIDHHSSMDEHALCNNKLMIPQSTDSLCSMMVRRSIIAAIPQPDLRNGEDMAIIPLLVASSNQFGKVDKCIYNYLCREESASNSATMKVVESLISSFEYIKKNMPAGFEAETEFIGIRNLLYGALLILYKCSNDTPRARTIIADFESNFPSWCENKYLSILPKSKKIFLYFVHHRLFFMLKVLSSLHAYIVKNG